MSRYLTTDREQITISTATGINPFAGLWSVISERAIEGNDAKFRPGAGQPEVVVAGRDSLSDVTISREWDSDRDPGLFRDLLKNRRTYSNLSVTTVELDTSDAVIPGTQQTFVGCVVQKAAKDGADAQGADATKLTLTITLGSVA